MAARRWSSRGSAARWSGCWPTACAAIFPADAELIEKIPPVLAARAGGEAKIAAIYRGEDGRRLVSILAPEQLFREDVMQRLKAGGGHAAKAKRKRPARRREERQFLVFRLGDDEFGLPIEAVDEVARVPGPDHAAAEDAEVPRRRRQPARRRAAGRRSAAPLRHAGARASSAARRLVVVRTERHRAGLIVDCGLGGAALPGRATSSRRPT